MGNFSSSKYFCRYCPVTRAEFHSKNGSCTIYPLRTAEPYENAVSRIGKKKTAKGSNLILLSMGKTTMFVHPGCLHA